MSDELVQLAKNHVLALVQKHLEVATTERDWAMVRLPNGELRTPGQAVSWGGRVFALESLRNSLVFDECSCGAYECKPYRCPANNRSKK